LAGRPIAGLTAEAIERSRAFEYAAIYRFVFYMLTALFSLSLVAVILWGFVSNRRAAPKTDSALLARKIKRQRIGIAIRTTLLLFLACAHVYFIGAEKQHARADTLLVPRVIDEYVGMIRMDYLLTKDNLDFLHDRIAELDRHDRARPGAD